MSDDIRSPEDGWQDSAADLPTGYYDTKTISAAQLADAAVKVKLDFWTPTGNEDARDGFKETAFDFDRWAAALFAALPSGADSLDVDGPQTSDTLDVAKVCPTCGHRPHNPGSCKARYRITGKPREVGDPCLCYDWRAEQQPVDMLDSLDVERLRKGFIQWWVSLAPKLGVPDQGVGTVHVDIAWARIKELARLASQSSPAEEEE